MIKSILSKMYGSESLNLVCHKSGLKLSEITDNELQAFGEAYGYDLERIAKEFRRVVAGRRLTALHWINMSDTNKENLKKSKPLEYLAYEILKLRGEGLFSTPKAIANIARLESEKANRLNEASHLTDSDIKLELDFQGFCELNKFSSIFYSDECFANYSAKEIEEAIKLVMIANCVDLAFSDVLNDLISVGYALKNKTFVDKLDKALKTKLEAIRNYYGYGSNYQLTFAQVEDFIALAYRTNQAEKKLRLAKMQEYRRINAFSTDTNGFHAFSVALLGLRQDDVNSFMPSIRQLAEQDKLKTKSIVVTNDGDLKIGKTVQKSQKDLDSNKINLKNIKLKF